MWRFGMAILAVGLAAATVARADDAPTSPPPPPPDKSGFTLFNPTPDADLRSFCADRPTKSTGPCTIDAGQWQIESDIYNVTTQTTDGVTTVTQLFTNPTLKLGLTNNWDVEVNIAPYEEVTTHDSLTGKTTTAEGVGDLFVRTKVNLVGDDGGDLSVAIEPWVKAPTAAAGVGNGAVEGGVLAPIQINLPLNWQLSLDPELDVLANAQGAGHHLNAISLLSFGYPLTKQLTGFVEVWGDLNFDPTGTVFQSSFDLAAAWIPPKDPNAQLDAGVNFGLNRVTPGVQGYVGVSHRF
jgi:hypothetical protein